MIRFILALVLVSSIVDTAFAQAAVQADQARRALLEERVRDFSTKTQPTVGKNIGGMLEVDRQINRVYQVLNNKYATQGKAPVDRKAQLRYFSSHGSVLPTASMTDEEAKAAEEAFFAQQEAALMTYVTIMQQARWAQKPAAPQKAKVIVVRDGPEQSPGHANDADEEASKTP